MFRPPGEQPLPVLEFASNREFQLARVNPVRLATLLAVDRPLHLGASLLAGAESIEERGELHACRDRGRQVADLSFAMAFITAMSTTDLSTRSPFEHRPVL